VSCIFMTCEAARNYAFLALGVQPQFCKDNSVRKQSCIFPGQVFDTIYWFLKFCYNIFIMDC